MLVKKDIRKTNLIKGLFFDKVAGLSIIFKPDHWFADWFLYDKEACNFIKKETLVHMFSCEFCETFKSTFFTEHLRATIGATTSDYWEKWI